MAMEHTRGGTHRAAALEKPKNTWSTVKRLLSYMKKLNLLILGTILAAALGTAMQVVSPKLLGGATTILFEGTRRKAGIDFGGLGLLLCLVAALYVGSFLTSFLQQRFMTLVSQKTAYVLRNEVKAKMNRVPVSYFDKHPNGELMSVAVNDIDNIVTNLQQGLTSIISSAVLFVGVVWMMLSISAPLTLMACVMIPGSILVMKTVTPLTKKYSAAYFGSLGKMNSQIEETFQGFTVVKSFNAEQKVLSEFDAVNAAMYENGWKSRFIGGVTVPGMLLVQNVVYVLLAAAGSIGVVAGKILIGNMQAFLQYSSQFSTPLMQFSGLWASILSMIVSAERVFEVLDANETGTCEASFPNKVGEAAKVAFEHVQFGYGGNLLMNDFTANIADGQMVAIVGHTGAGKTTLIHLLERFYEIQGGGLRIDGIDIRNMDTAALRGRIGMVLQDTWLFSGTIYDNIKYGNENATDEQVYAAAKAAYADAFIQKLPQGYGTLLGEDAENLSQGQRQLITIARAFVSNPEILILDEATSNVDSRTELVIQKAMKRLLKGRTSFVVAHRLSTIYDADRILVMDSGDVVESGTHKELLGQNGVYADIYNSQFAGSAA